MALKGKPMRYGHPDGHTHICYYINNETQQQEALVTCGSDGDVRLWVNLLDDDPGDVCIAEQALTAICKDGKIFVGTDDNIVQILSYPNLEKEGILTRFSAPISVLSTTKSSNLIAVGSCDMKIKIVDINTLESTILNGHVAPILGLSLDPREEFVASSSADGSIRIWDIKEKSAIHIWEDIVPKSNSFFTSTSFCTPSFDPIDGKYLAYPFKKVVIVVQRSLWEESFKLSSSKLNHDLSICKFSECGTLLAATSTHGEMIVWDVKSTLQIGYLEHPQDSTITSMCWHPHKSDEIVFSDNKGQLGYLNITCDNLVPHSNEKIIEDEIETDLLLQNDGDDDEEGVISLNKIKESVKLDDIESVCSNQKSEKLDQTFVPRFDLQLPFQPGSSPVHLLSRYMMWNDIGIIKCFTTEDGEDSNIEVEFHDVTIHRNIRMSNYARHTLAALSTKALVLACPIDNDEKAASRIVTLLLQGWGSGNKEWHQEMPEGEEVQSITVGDNFIAAATSLGYLRIFMIGGTQREIISLPGSVVAMNAIKNHLLVAYHNGIGIPGNQQMNLLWIKVDGLYLHTSKLDVPLFPNRELMWLGFTDFGSPAVVDSEDVIKIYDKKRGLWRVIGDMNKQNKGVGDHYFIIGINEERRNLRCVLCKGSYYPATTPRPVVIELSMIVPVCNTESEKSIKEMDLWKPISTATEQNQALLALFAIACKSNVEYRAVDLCENVASEIVLNMAIKYAAQSGRFALSNKLESLIKNDDNSNEKDRLENNEDNDIEKCNGFDNDNDLNLSINPMQNKPAFEIKPLSMNKRKSDRFLKTQNSPRPSGLTGLNEILDKPVISEPKITSIIRSKPTKVKSDQTSLTFSKWFKDNKQNLAKEFSGLSTVELTRIAFPRYQELNLTEETEPDQKKRKLSDIETSPSNQTNSSQKTLRAFVYDK